MRTPEFWSRKDLAAGLAAAAMSPIGWAYGATVAWKRDHETRYRPRANVVCVGNLTVGGTGKTPVAIAFARALVARRIDVIFLTRGYGGSAAGPLVVDPAHHSAREAGDEALLLANVAPTIVARDRRAGAALADSRGAQVIVMDDGYQNFTLEKDLSVVVVDAEAGFGNGKIVPAGPLRESTIQGLSRADAVVLMGDGNPELPDFGGPVLRARLLPEEPPMLRGVRIVAFAGIGRPEKFFATLKALGAELAQTHAYPDHHAYTADEIAQLRSRAAAAGATLITTEKDHVRISPGDRRDIGALPVRAVFDDPGAFETLTKRLSESASHPPSARHCSDETA